MMRGLVASNKSLSACTERKWPRVFGGEYYLDELMRRIQGDIELRKPRRILECGGVDRPLLRRSQDYAYVGLDIEDRPGCRTLYDEFLVQSIEEPIETSVDMVISTTLLEHVRDNDRAVSQIFRALNRNGTTHHYIPSKHHAYSLILRLVGPTAQKRLIRTLRPEAAAVTGYPAFFDHCSPGAMRRLFVRHGFSDVNIRPFFRANGYFDFLYPAYVFISFFENLCRAMNWQTLCSGLVISATKR